MIAALYVPLTALAFCFGFFFICSHYLDKEIEQDIKKADKQQGKVIAFHRKEVKLNQFNGNWRSYRE